MRRDPVIEEVRRHGAALAEECGGDIHRMAELLRKKQNEDPARVVRRSPRPSLPAQGKPEG